MKRLTIAIDGPSGAGKGTISRTIAEQLGYRHIDTGAMYRAVGWKALQEGLALEDEAPIAALARRADIAVEGGEVRIDGHDITRAIRTPEIDKAADAITARDAADSTRTVSPLAMAPDAIRLDTTGLSINESVARAIAIVREKSSGQ
jgi:cytidylate kinase